MSTPVHSYGSPGQPKRFTTLIERNSDRGGADPREAFLPRRFVTERYADLQGLRLVPLGVAFLISAAWRAGLLPWVRPSTDQQARRWFVALLTVAVSLSFPIRTAYQRRFGRLRSHRTRTGALTLSMVAGGFFLTLAWPHPPGSLSMPAMFIGLALIYPGVVAGALRWHYLLIAAAWLSFAAVPLLDAPAPARRLALDVLIGLSLIVAGLGDHHVLRRTFGSPEKALYARTH